MVPYTLFFPFESSRRKRERKKKDYGEVGKNLNTEIESMDDNEGGEGNKTTPIKEKAGGSETK